MKTILILNGPPGSGKDTLADALVEAFGWQKVEFKAALRQDTASPFDVSLESLRALESTKEIPNPLLRHPETNEPMSLRQALIYTSEGVIKPKHGKMYYGQRLAETVSASDASFFICSDGGFDHEIIPLLDAGLRVRIMRIDRPGYTFANDSRDYISETFVLAASESGYDIFMADFVNADGYAKFIEEGSVKALAIC